MELRESAPRNLSSRVLTNGAPFRFWGRWMKTANVKLCQCRASARNAIFNDALYLSTFSNTPEIQKQTMILGRRRVEVAFDGRLGAICAERRFQKSAV